MSNYTGCRWCGCQVQFCDPMGTCARCKLPEKQEHWLNIHWDSFRAMAKLNQAAASSMIPMPGHEHEYHKS